MRKFLKFFGICIHDWKRITKTPKMEDIEGQGYCQYEVVYRCRHCAKKKVGKSDIYWGMKIVE